jgi:uncharacterized protein
MDPVVRQCMACRKNDEKKNLMRIVRIPGGAIEFDPAQRKEGRGAYLCAKAECLTKAKSRHLIGEEFGLPDPPDVYVELAKTLLIGKGSSAEALIGFAVRSRRCVMGTTAVEQAFERNRIRLLILSENAGPSTRMKMEGLAEGKTVPVTIFRGPRPLEALTGKANCQVLGILDGNFARKIQQALNERIGGGDG